MTSSDGWEGQSTPPKKLNKPTTDWYPRCQTRRGGGVISNHANVMLALRQDPAWQGVVGFDLMRDQVMLLRAIPVFANSQASPLLRPRPWADIDDAIAQEWLQIAGLPGVSIQTVVTAIVQRAHELEFHPIRDWLETLKWDGVPRINGGTLQAGEILEPWLTAYFGADSSDYVRAVGEMWLISAVARVMEPGCKAYHMLILEGRQGSGKSTACRILAGDDFFSDTLPQIGHKDAWGHLKGKWIIEVAELDAMSKAESTDVKAFLTQQIDKFRPPYGRHEIEHARQCVFIGTTNQSSYLKDETGGRRYWPVQTTRIDISALSMDRDQLWAEAFRLYRDGHHWHITDPVLLYAAEQEQANRFDADVWEETIGTYLHGRQSVTIGEIMKEQLGFENARMDRGSQNRVRRILSRLGWQKSRRTNSGVLWVKPSDLPN